MTAIADQSDVTNEAQGWLLIAAVALLAFVVWAVAEWRQARADRHWEQSRPPAPHRPCHTTACRYPATVMVMTRPNAGVVAVHDVCQGCSDEGTAHGWWQPLPVGAPTGSF